MAPLQETSNSSAEVSRETDRELKRELNVKLVVIDDDPANLKLARFVLASEGLEIHSAGDPKSGMNVIRQVRPQIVLLDLVMPRAGHGIAAGNPGIRSGNRRDPDDRLLLDG